MTPGRLESRVVLLLVAGAVGVVLAALAGAWAGRAATGGDEEPVPRARVVGVGPARLAVPTGWRPAALDGAGIGRLDPKRAVAFEPTPGLAARAVAIFAPVDDASLIPSVLRAAFPGSPGRPSATRVGGRPAWLYNGLTQRPSGRGADVTVLPTTAGVLAIACTAPASLWPTGSGCAAEVDSVAVPGKAVLLPSPSLALALRLPDAVLRLDRDRLAHREELSRASRPAAQALAARKLAADHATAAAALRPFAGPAGAPLLRRLVRSQDAYGALEQAAVEGSPAAYAAAGRAVRATDAALTRAVAAVPPPKPAPAARAAVRVPAPAAPRASSDLSPLLFPLLALLAAVAGLAAGMTGAGPRLWSRLRT